VDSLNREEHAMARYVDGFVIPVPKRKVKAYLRMRRGES